MSDTLPAVPASSVATMQSFEPSNWKEMLDLAVALSKSSIIPSGLVGKPSDVLVILMNGRELGLGPMQALRSIYVVEGRPSLSAALKIGLCLRSRACEYFSLKESTVTSCTYETKRVGALGPTTLTFTIEDAKRAGVASRGNWLKFPAAMLRARCGSALAETVYPDVVGNLYDADELDTATADPAPPKRTKAKPEVVEQPVAPATEPPAAPEAKHEVEILSDPKPAASEVGATMDAIVQEPMQPPPPRTKSKVTPTASAPAVSPPKADAPQANGKLTSWRGLTAEEWKLLDENELSLNKDITRKQVKLILSLAKSKGLVNAKGEGDHDLVMKSLRDDFAAEFSEWGVQQLWQINSQMASWAIEALKN